MPPSPIVVQGLIVDVANNPATGGYVLFELSPLNQGLAYEIPGVCVIASATKGVINSNGLLKALDGVSDLLIWPNDLILPSNTLYNITIAPNNRVTRVYNNVLLKSIQNPQDMSQFTFILPQPVIGTVIEGSPLVTESVIPLLDNVFTLGDVDHRYAKVFANIIEDFLFDLTVDELHVTGFIDNPDLGEPVRIQDDLTLTGCLTFETDAGVHTDELCPAVGANFTHQLPATNGVLAPIASPVFTGVPEAPTPAPADNSDRIATTAFVQTFVAPTSPVTSVFGRIGAIAAVAGDYDVTEVTGAAPLANPTFTGDPKAPTPAAGDNDTSIATTAFVQAALAGTTPSPTKQVLGGNVALPANTLTSVITKVVNFPAGAGVYRVDIRYSLWGTVGPNVFASEVVDTTNSRHFAPCCADSNGTGYECLTGAEISTQTYAGGSSATFVLKAMSNSNSTATVSSGIFSAAITSPSFLEITPLLTS
jgi:hypothetical protein